MSHTSNTRHRYSITPANPGAHLFEVTLTVEKPDPAGQVFAIPAWIPGSYMIRDYAKHVVSIRAESDGVGIALVGNESVYGRLQGEGRRPEFAQLFSRIGMRFTRPKPYSEDVCELIKAWKVEDETTVRLLKAIASKPGALRGMTKVLRIATAFAKGSGQALNASHVNAAWKRLSEDGGAA